MSVIEAPTRYTADQKRIMRAINARIRSGLPFATDSIWPRLKDISPKDHQSWLGGRMSKLAEAGRIQHVGWTVTEMSKSHSRSVHLWRGVPEEERT